MTSIDEAKTILKEHKDEVIRKYGVSEIGIFGSFVRGEQKKRSDIDVLVEYDEIPDLFEFINLERYLQRLLGKKIDLVRKEAIRPEIRERILREVVYI
ncbi:MAG TPA: nucleotidyltransferase family protein [Thermodesulfovibrionales bacterium]|nr:nucleotidyltransferase family protein [Thermodesulfovibrionales bacterium]